MKYKSGAIRKRTIFLVIAGLLILAGVVVLSKSPLGDVLFSSKSHFIVHPVDDRVLYEPGAEKHANQIANFLEYAVQVVEKGHQKPFHKPFKVYVCATQESHNKFIGDRSGYPIRGCSLWGNVYIAPAAFQFHGQDTHKATLIHELSHQHLWQSLGFLWNRKMPFWFSEGLADHLAGLGGVGISDAQAVKEILEGNHFTLNEDQSVTSTLRKVIISAGISPVMFHAQVKLFVDYIASANPEAFGKFVAAVENKRAFEQSFEELYGVSIAGKWEQFIDHYSDGKALNSQ